MLKINDVETRKLPNGTIVTGKISKAEQARRLELNLAEVASRKKVAEQYDHYLNLYPQNKVGSGLFRLAVYCVIVPVELVGIAASLVGMIWNNTVGKIFN